MILAQFSALFTWYALVVCLDVKFINILQYNELDMNELTRLVTGFI